MRDTLMRVRDLRPDSGAPASDDEVLPVWLIAGGSGAGAALASTTMLVVLAVLGWLTGAGGSESAGATVAAGVAGWAFAHGGPIHLGDGHVGLIPWLLTGWPLLCTWWSAQRIVPDRDETSPRLRGFGGVRRDVVVAGGAFAVGYVLTALALVVAAHLGGARPSIGTTAVGATVLAALAYALALAPSYRGRLGELAPRVEWARREYLPLWVERALRPAGEALAATLAAGALLVLAMVAVNGGQVAEIYARVGGGVVGATLLTLAQLAYLPTLAMWAVSWLAGPGFMIGGGSSVTWASSDPGVIPLVPVLAALPAPGPLPAWTPVGIVVPIVIGAVMGWRCVRRSEAGWAARLRLTGVAVAVFGLGALVASVAASGAVGAGRFAHVGLDPLVTALALTGEVGGTALLVAASSCVRLRRPDAVGRRVADDVVHEDEAPS